MDGASRPELGWYAQRSTHAPWRCPPLDDVSNRISRRLYTSPMSLMTYYAVRVNATGMAGMAQGLQSSGAGMELLKLMKPNPRSPVAYIVAHSVSIQR